jgi:hypothetical protein
MRFHFHDWSDWIIKWFDKGYYDEATWFERFCRICGKEEQKER